MISENFESILNMKERRLSRKGVIFSVFNNNKGTQRTLLAFPFKGCSVVKNCLRPESVPLQV